MIYYDTSSDYDILSASEKYSFFIDVISHFISYNTPKRKLYNDKIHRNPVQWWDPECDRAKRLRKANLKRYQYTSDPSDQIKYKKSVAEAKKMFKSKKRKYFQKISESINFNINRSYVWNVSKILKNKWAKTSPSHTPENHQQKEKVNAALDKISPPWVAPNPDWLPEYQENDFLNSPFDFRKFNIALNSKTLTQLRASMALTMTVYNAYL